MSQTEDATTEFRWSVAFGRLTIGLAQGLALYWLLHSREVHAWPGTAALVFAPLMVVLLMAPLPLLGALGRMRLLPLLVWTALGAAAVATFAWYDRTGAALPLSIPGPISSEPEFPTMLASVVFLFVGHHLVTAADAARRPLAPYPDYFDGAWKDAVQVALSLAFVGVFWLALRLGAALFELIGINTFRDIVTKEWFAFPASTLAFAIAVQLTDVRIGLIRGVRTVGLVLLGWLLPLATLIAVAFLAALPFTGLQPLFATRYAAAILLAAAAGLIILINAAYQDGASNTPRVLKAAVLAAAIALVPLIAIAGYALTLRIDQHGFTPERVWALACVTIGGGYALGYVIAAALSFRGWMKGLEIANLLMALVVLAAIVALFTPIADPARLSVDSQLARLSGGQVTPDHFDFRFLHRDAGRYGQEALERLRHASATPQDRLIAAAAEHDISQEDNFQPEPPTNPADQFTVYPAHAALPGGFSDIHAFAGDPPPCLVQNYTHCDAYLADMDGDGAQEVLLTETRPFVQPDGVQFTVFSHRTGRWAALGRFELCDGDLGALRAGRFSFGPAQGRDLVIGETRHALLPAACNSRADVPTPVLQPGVGHSDAER